MIHLPQNITLGEIRRVLELIQKDTISQATLNAAQASPQTAGSASTSAVAVKGDKGDKGDPGADGIANLDILVMSRNENDLVVVNNAGDVVSNGNGYAVLARKIDWSLVTDNNGNIITLE